MNFARETPMAPENRLHSPALQNPLPNSSSSCSSSLYFSPQWNPFEENFLERTPNFPAVMYDDSLTENQSPSSNVEHGRFDSAMETSSDPLLNFLGSTSDNYNGNYDATMPFSFCCFSNSAMELPAPDVAARQDNFSVSGLPEIPSVDLPLPVSSNFDWVDASTENPLHGLESTSKRKKAKAWSEKEHSLFLLGLKICGRGDWKNISRNYVRTRTSTQVASHAQKYFLRNEAAEQGVYRKRPSIHDTTTVDTELEAQLLAEINQIRCCPHLSSPRIQPQLTQSAPPLLPPQQFTYSSYVPEQYFNSPHL